MERRCPYYSVLVISSLRPHEKDKEIYIAIAAAMVSKDFLSLVNTELFSANLAAIIAEHLSTRQ